MESGTLKFPDDFDVMAEEFDRFHSLDECVETYRVCIRIKNSKAASELIIPNFLTPLIMKDFVRLGKEHLFRGDAELACVKIRDANGNALVFRPAHDAISVVLNQTTNFKSGDMTSLSFEYPRALWEQPPEGIRRKLLYLLTRRIPSLAVGRFGYYWSNGTPPEKDTLILRFPSVLDLRIINKDLEKCDPDTQEFMTSEDGKTHLWKFDLKKPGEERYMRYYLEPKTTLVLWLVFFFMVSVALIPLSAFAVVLPIFTPSDKMIFIITMLTLPFALLMTARSWLFYEAFQMALTRLDELYLIAAGLDAVFTILESLYVLLPGATLIRLLN